MLTTFIFAASVLLILYLVFRFSYTEEGYKRFIKDDQGRLLILHGVNVINAAKHDPLRVGDTTREDFLRISRQWGFNAVRLLIFWDGIEPQKGRYDQAYLQRVRQRLNWCAEAGLFVILDMHQDLYSIQFSGDGAPEWAIQDDDQPYEQQTPWELNYLQPAVKAAINNFWIPEKGYPELQDHFVNATLKAVDTLADHPSVIGIDLYNEPTMASLHGIINFEKRYLTPLLQRLIDSIRVKHRDLWLFFEPAALGPNQGFSSKLGNLTDPRNGESRLVYFPHLYTLDLDIRGKYLGWPLFTSFWAHQTAKHLEIQ
jgi:endoglycosylceramidase